MTASSRAPSWFKPSASAWRLDPHLLLRNNYLSVPPPSHTSSSTSSLGPFPCQSAHPCLTRRLGFSVHFWSLWSAELLFIILLWVWLFRSSSSNSNKIMWTWNSSIIRGQKSKRSSSSSSAASLHLIILKLIVRLLVTSHEWSKPRPKDTKPYP